MRHKKQSGFLLVSAVVIIVIAGFMVAVFMHMLTASNEANVNYNDAMQSYYIATSGIEYSLNHSTCTNVITPVSLGAGQFTLTDAAAINTNTTLSDAINSTQTYIPVSSISHLANIGLATIGAEQLTYLDTSNSASVCHNEAPCLSGVTRGAQSSSATSHSNGTALSQNGCVVISSAAVPSFSHARGRSEFLNFRTAGSSAASTGGAIVGKNEDHDILFLNRNPPAGTTWLDASVTNKDRHADLLGVSLNNASNGWAVGRKKKSHLSIWHWNGNAWSTASGIPTLSASYVKDLQSVSTVSDSEAWAVGTKSSRVSGKYAFSIFRELNGQWCRLQSTGSTCGGKHAPSTSKNNAEDLYSVSVIRQAGQDFGFAVGKKGVILKYNGSSWAQITSNTHQNLLSVDVVSATQAFAVGNKGTLIEWNGQTWFHPVSNISSKSQLKGIRMLDTSDSGTANDGWAVGYRGSSARAYHYNGSTWTEINPATRKLYAVDMQSPSDVWVTGIHGTIAHWNGSQWHNIQALTTEDLNSISLVGTGGSSVALSLSKEIYN
jgi:hypothetical protein